MAVTDLISAGIIEKDSHGDVLWTWAFPSVTPQQREVFLRWSGLVPGQSSATSPEHSYVYSQFQDKWFYIRTMKGSANTPNVTHFSLVLQSRDFNPEKYELLSSVLSRLYARTGSPAALLERYLSVTVQGSCEGEENGTFVVRDFNVQRAYATTAVRDVIARFGIEVIFLYTAMLLKKRVVLYHTNVEELMLFVRTLPALVWHRQTWGVCYPLVSPHGPEISHLLGAKHYVAGFTDASVENRSDVYDIFVNITTSEIAVAPHAKEYFVLGKLHKELATFLVQCAEDESRSDHQIIKDVGAKTKELLSNLQSLSSEDSDGTLVIKLDTLRERKMAAATEHFLFNLATAEGMAES